MRIIKAFKGQQCHSAHLLLQLYRGMTMGRITLGNVGVPWFLEKGVEELGKDGRKREKRDVHCEMRFKSWYSKNLYVYFRSVLRLNSYGAGLEGNAVRFRCMESRLCYLVSYERVQ